MNQTLINIETKRKYVYMELRNDVASVSLHTKRSETPKDFPLLLILYMNIKLKIKTALICLFRNTNQSYKKFSL